MIGAGFLGGAKSRLLPASIPFRFFATAAGFHVLAWGSLLLSADEIARYEGGIGVPLAAIHLLTLGVFVMTAMGAAFQLLPVATRQPLISIWPARIAYWVFTPGVFVLAAGMWNGETLLLWPGAVLVSAGLTIFLCLVAINLRRAQDVPVSAAHSWIALGAIAVLTGLGLALVVDFSTGFLGDHQAVALAHMIFAVYGFMGLLVFGFALILIPMFALSKVPPAGPSWVGLGIGVSALVCGAWGILADSTIMTGAALVLGSFAAGCHIWAMGWTLKQRMRKRLEPFFFMLQAAWGLLALSLLIPLAGYAGIHIPNAATLFGFVALAGWLLTFLLGVLQRIMPFLASMHISGTGRKPPLVSELSAAVPLKIHTYCHMSALALVSAGIVSEISELIAAGAAIGLAGSIAFAVFAGKVITKL